MAVDGTLARTTASLEAAKVFTQHGNDAASLSAVVANDYADLLSSGLKEAA